MKIRDAAEFFRTLDISEFQRTVGRTMLEQVENRLGYLESVGLGYLTLDRTLAHPQRRRGATRRAHRGTGLQPGQHALRARRTLDRPAPPRHRSTDRRDSGASQPAQHRRGRRTRRGDDPRGRPGHRDRTRRRRTRRPGRLPRHARGDGTGTGKSHRRLPGPDVAASTPAVAAGAPNAAGSVWPARGGTTSTTSRSSFPSGCSAW